MRSGDSGCSSSAALLSCLLRVGVSGCSVGVGGACVGDSCDGDASGADAGFSSKPRHYAPQHEHAYGFVYCFDVMVHMDAHAMFRCLKRIRSLLKRDGRAFISTSNLLAPDGCRRFEAQEKYSVGGFYCVTPETVRCLVARAGLRGVRDLGEPDASNTYYHRDYLALLAAGGSSSPRELVAKLGLDLSDPGVWHRGLSVVDHDAERAGVCGDAGCAAGCRRHGTLFRCAAGCDWDVCAACFDKGVHLRSDAGRFNQQHKPEHRMDEMPQEDTVLHQLQLGTA